LGLLKVPLAGFFNNCGQLSELLFRLVFPVQDWWMCIQLSTWCDAGRKRAQDSQSAA